MTLVNAGNVDAAMKSWRQGDCYVGPFEFVSVDSDGAIVMDETRGFMLLTQTCDVVRSCAHRPSLEIAALEEIPELQWPFVVNGSTPRYITCQALHEARLAADLDRVMTLSKGFVSRSTRQSGWSTDAQERVLRASMARKRGRPALPDALVAALEPLRKRWVKRHGKASAEGQALPLLDEIRVTAWPSYDADAVHLGLWLVCGDDAAVTACAQMLEDWERELGAGGRYSFAMRVVTLHEVSAQMYVESDRLDLDHLTVSMA